MIGALLLMTMAGCSKSLEEKINDNELKAEDYAEMVDYIFDAMDYRNTIDTIYSEDETEEAAPFIADVVEEYPLVPLYSTACVRAVSNNDPEFAKSVSASKMAELMQYQLRGWLNLW